jgi:1,2-dihydroxy-3-keto-5-methylthiopentene dioxygenase
MPSLSSVDALASERGYRNRDEITVSPAAMGDAYEAKVRSFFDEHLHEDEEIRYVRDGTGYFDVRGKREEWIRIQLDKVCFAPSEGWMADGRGEGLMRGRMI